MRKRLLPFLFCLLLLLSLPACGFRDPNPENGDDRLTLAATTYPVYLFACEVTRGAESVDVTLVVNESVGCLHNYTLSIRDMKVLDQADVVILNGAGLEDSMSHALDAADSLQIDCSEGIPLLMSGHDHDHDHAHGDAPEADLDEDHDTGHDEADHIGEDDHETEEGEPDPHIWMDPMRACRMLENLARGLGELDPEHAALYTANAQAAGEKVSAAYQELKPLLDELSCRGLITFHDGFPYFAEAFGLTILRSIEEEAGSEASARDVMEILDEIAIHHVPAIFTEINGSTATAQVIHREVGIPLFSLDMLMSGETRDVGIDTYISGITANVMTIQEACS
ncbi:MAG: zinc ABC transporter substrate-binding protein [Ruminiclostridium sp.]|nr:zinc ABC transporter substrate-binding protein [Ruminiclostridium sp.]